MIREMFGEPTAEDSTTMLFQHVGRRKVVTVFWDEKPMTKEDRDAFAKATGARPPGWFAIRPRLVKIGRLSATFTPAFLP